MLTNFNDYQVKAINRETARGSDYEPRNIVDFFLYYKK